MNRRATGVALLVLAGVIVAGAGAWLALNGPGGSRGEAISESVAVGPFSGLEIDGNAHVALVAGGESVNVELPARNRGRVRIDIADGVLKISYRASGRWWEEIFGEHATPPRITVHYRSVESVAIAGAVKLTATGMRANDLELHAIGAGTVNFADLQAHNLRVAASGALKATMAGRVESQAIHISGAGDYRAADLFSRDASVHVSGAGRVIIHAERTLAVALSGAGNVEYLGNPKVTERVSGVGRVRRRETTEG